jgi:hypothetical protein
VPVAAHCVARVSPSSNANGVLWSPRGVSRGDFSPCRPYAAIHVRPGGFAAPNGWLGTYRGSEIHFANGEKLVARGLRSGWKLAKVVVSPTNPHLALANAQSPMAGNEECRTGLGITYRVTPAVTKAVLQYNPCRLDPHVAWSPDGTHMSYLQGPRQLLYIADGYGRSAVVLAPGVDNYLWSPDGSQIAYDVFDSRAPRVAVVDVATGQSRNVAAGTLGAWSPDGTELAVISGSKLRQVPLVAVS